MVLKVKVDRVRKKARLDESYDEDIKETIDEMLPYIESRICPECLVDDSKLPILNLAATNIIVGEFLREQSNDEMDSDGDLGVGPIKLGGSKSSSSESRLKRANEYIDSGWHMLEDCLIDNTGNPFFFGYM